MKNHKYLLVLVVLLIFVSCATPTQPTGGPPDQTPPEIVSTSPQNESTNFSSNEIRFNFNKYVDRTSFNRAFRIDPDFNLNYSVNFRGRSVRVVFEDSLPDSTTIIFTLGTELSDNNRNRLTSPYQLAISTGDRIDSGQIIGRVVDAQTGVGMQDAFIFLYREPVNLDESADFVAQTDTSGRFSFNYLPSTGYKAIWIDDRNRNRRWDMQSESARPFNIETFQLMEDEKFDIGAVFLSEPDTLRPILQGVGMLTSNRLRLRFSKNMVIDRDQSEISILDEAGNIVTDAIALYVDKDQINVVFAQNSEQLNEDEEYYLELFGITDENNNNVRPNKITFTGSAEPDTSRTRVILHSTKDGVLQNEPHEFILSNIPSSSTLLDSLQIIQDEIIYTDWEKKFLVDNRLIIEPIDEWETGSTYTARIFIEETGRWNNYDLMFFPDSKLGGINFVIQEEFVDEDIYHLAKIINIEGTIVLEFSFSDEIEIDNLPSGNYTIIVYKDLDGNGKRQLGQVTPYIAPEPVFIKRNVSVPERMVGEIVIDYEF